MRAVRMLQRETALGTKPVYSIESAFTSDMARRDFAGRLNGGNYAIGIEYLPDEMRMAYLRIDAVLPRGY